MCINFNFSSLIEYQENKNYYSIPKTPFFVFKRKKLKLEGFPGNSLKSELDEALRLDS